MTESQSIRVPPACSPLEGVHLLAVLLRGQSERLGRLSALLPEEGRRELEPSTAALRELLWRARAILGGTGPARHGELELALLELAGLGGGRREVSGRGATRRRRLLDELESGREQLGGAAKQCLGLFPDSEYQDEFRLLAGLAREQEQVLGALRKSLT